MSGIIWLIGWQCDCTPLYKFGIDGEVSGFTREEFAHRRRSCSYCESEIRYIQATPEEAKARQEQFDLAVQP